MKELKDRIRLIRTGPFNVTIETWSEPYTAMKKGKPVEVEGKWNFFGYAGNSPYAVASVVLQAIGELELSDNIEGLEDVVTELNSVMMGATELMAHLINTLRDSEMMSTTEGKPFYKLSPQEFKDLYK